MSIRTRGKQYVRYITNTCQASIITRGKQYVRDRKNK